MSRPCPLSWQNAEAYPEAACSEAQMVSDAVVTYQISVCLSHYLSPIMQQLVTKL